MHSRTKPERGERLVGRARQAEVRSVQALLVVGAITTARSGSSPSE